MEILTKTINKVNNTMAAITTSLKNIPSKWELCQHAQTMEEQIVQV